MGTRPALTLQLESRTVRRPWLYSLEWHLRTLAFDPGTKGTGFMCSVNQPAVGEVPTAVGGAPTAVEGAPTAVEGVPTAVGGVSMPVGVVPAAVGGVPAAVGGAAAGEVPTAVGGIPTAVGRVPMAVGGVPGAIGGVPTAYEGVPVGGTDISLRGTSSGWRGTSGGRRPFKPKHPAATEPPPKLGAALPKSHGMQKHWKCFQLLFPTESLNNRPPPSPPPHTLILNKSTYVSAPGTHPYIGNCQCSATPQREAALATMARRGES